MNAARGAKRRPKMVVHRDYTVSLDGREIGYVYPDPTDKTVNHSWCYAHASRMELRDIHPDWSWWRKYQSSSTKRGAAQLLVELDRKIAAREAVKR